MKKPVLLLTVFCLSLGLTAAVLFMTGAMKLPWSPVRITSVYTELVKSSESSLIETARYRMKLIFPYDFVDTGDDVNWSLLQWYYNRLPAEFASRAAEEYYPDRIIPPEWKYGRLYRVCREAGIDPAGKDSEFVVITVTARAGFDFKGAAISLQDLSSDRSEGHSIGLVLPRPGITSIIVEDRSSAEEGFPEVSISPARWSLLIAEIIPEVEDLAVREGLLDSAAEGAEQLLTNLFQGAGIGVEKITYSDSL